MSGGQAGAVKSGEAKIQRHNDMLTNLEQSSYIIEKHSIMQHLYTWLHKSNQYGRGGEMIAMLESALDHHHEEAVRYLLIFTICNIF